MPFRLFANRYTQGMRFIQAPGLLLDSGMRRNDGCGECPASVEYDAVGVQVNTGIGGNDADWK